MHAQIIYLQQLITDKNVLFIDETLSLPMHTEYIYILKPVFKPDGSFAAVCDKLTHLYAERRRCCPLNAL